jgi:hypothetical protein
LIYEFHTEKKLFEEVTEKNVHANYYFYQLSLVLERNKKFSFNSIEEYFSFINKTAHAQLINVLDEVIIRA